MAHDFLAAILFTFLWFALVWLDSVSLILFFFCTEDIDPSVGRFRNMIQTTVIPNKVKKNTFSGWLWIPFENLYDKEC